MRIKLHFSGLLVILASVLFERGEMIALFFAAALLHELGHLFLAKILKKTVERIDIGFSGARIRIKDGILGYGEEFLIAFMGPLFNILTACAVLLMFSLFGVPPIETIEKGMSFLKNGGSERVEIFGFLAISSMAQALLNLLPVKSLDGGRMVYCFFASRFGERAGERVIELASVAVAFVAWTVALYLIMKVSAGLALFVFAVWIFCNLSS